jgi:hypothetical protein
LSVLAESEMLSIAPAPVENWTVRTEDQPQSIVALLVQALMQPERYSIVTRDGEIFIEPVGSPTLPRAG